jgi:alkylation response protein AidB-like acyl-CoA dehydrogenase
LAVRPIAHAEAAFGWTLEYIKERKAFGSADRFVSGRETPHGRDAHRARHRPGLRRSPDHGVERRRADAEEAAKSKWWVTELEKRVIDSCLQLFGGWGYMEEYPIARAYRDARVQTIYGGTTEIMKEIVGRSLGL